MWENMKPWMYAAGHVFTPCVLGFIDAGIGAPFLTTGYTFTRVFKSFIYGCGIEEIPIFFWNLAIANSIAGALKKAEEIAKS